MKIIAKIHNSYQEKFGIPRQSGIVENLSTIVFEPEYRVREAFNGIEKYSHLWLLWQFSENEGKDWSPTVRPPKLGGNTRVGVFATRSPFRPNSIGLSCVKLIEVVFDQKTGPTLIVSGADLMDGTPILDVKPYVTYTDSRPDAVSSFALPPDSKRLKVLCERPFNVPEQTLNEIIEIISQNPIPAYKKEPDRVYKMSYGGYTVHFTVDECDAIIKNIVKELAI